MITLIKDNRYQIVLVAVFAMFVKLYVVDFVKILAIAHADNVLTFYAFLNSHPDSFSNDVAGIFGPAWLKNSILFWLPVVLNKFINLNPFGMNTFLTYLQVVLLGVSVFSLAREYSKNNILSFATSIFSMVLFIWNWNLASYGLVFHYSYYVTMILPFLIYAAIFYVREKYIVSYLMLVMAALLHPAIALYLLSSLFVYHIIRFSIRSLFCKKYVAFYLSILIVSVLPALYHQKYSGYEFVSKAYQWFCISHHMHSVPWKEYPPVWDLVYSSFITFAVVSIFSFVKIREHLDQRWIRHLLSIAIVVVIFAILHLVAYVLQSIMLMQLLGLRATMLYLVFLFPIIMFHIYKSITKGNFLESWFNAVMFLYLILKSYDSSFGTGLFLPILVSYSLFYIVDFFANKNHAKIIKNILILLCISTSYYAIAVSHEINFVMIGKVLTLKDLHIIFVGAFIVSLFDFSINKSTVNSNFRIGFIASIWLVFPVCILLYKGKKYPKYNYRVEQLYQAQVWARENTDPNDSFISKEQGWRTISERPVVSSKPNLTMMVYSPYKVLKDMNEYLFELYDYSTEDRNKSVYEMNRLVDQKFNQLSEEKLKKFSKKYHAKYLVTKKDSPSWNLPEVYSNSLYSIYKLW